MGRTEGGIWSLDVPNPKRAIQTVPGGGGSPAEPISTVGKDSVGKGRNSTVVFEKRGDVSHFQAIELRPHSCDWDHNSSEQGYGIFNEYAYYQWGQGRGENQGRHITKMV